MEVVKDPQMAIMNLMADIDHDIEGIRVHGSDPLDGNNWEVGEAFFRNWVSVCLLCCSHVYVLILATLIPSAIFAQASYSGIYLIKAHLIELHQPTFTELDPTLFIYFRCFQTCC